MGSGADVLGGEVGGMSVFLRGCGFCQESSDDVSEWAGEVSLSPKQSHASWPLGGGMHARIILTILS